MIQRNMSYSDAIGFNFTRYELNPNKDDQSVMNYSAVSLTYFVPPNKYLKATD